MPDTGAPWNIPYVENADLVSDWPADSLLVANAVAAGLSAAQNAGIGSNVVQTVKTDTFTTTSTSYTDVTGLSVSITPSNNTSRVLILATLQLSDAIAGTAYVELRRGSTSIFIGDANGSRVRASGQGTGAAASLLGYQMQTVTLANVDSPATASSVTYAVRMRTDGSTGYINRFGADDNNSSYGTVASSIIAIEVAA